MKSISISGTQRANIGKKATKEVRKQGLVPCVMYGEKKDANGAPEALHFLVDEKQINKVVYTPNIYLVNIDIDGKAHKAVVKEIQFHSVKDNVLHVDFYEVTDEKPIVMAVPIAPKGLAEGVRAGGKLVTMVRKLKVRAAVNTIPEKLDIDVTQLGLGKSIKCGELSYEGLELVTPKEVVVVTVKMTRAAKGAAAAAAAAAKK
ncbi:MAG: 50S ribosomal protein L25/general stress protein Ctc [Bacteroidales bacterium]|nr:50S ribosomal protein L25/general stress protein Ctc [Bacteroidales bacterium]